MKQSSRTSLPSTLSFIVIAIGLFLLVAVGASPAASAQAPAARRSPDEARAELVRRKIKFDRYGKTMPAGLQNAIIQGDFELVMLFLDAGTNPNWLSEKGISALHYAACNDRIEIIDELLERGADINIKDQDGESALLMAVSCAQPRAIEHLIQKGININAQDAKGNSFALSRAIASLLEDRTPARKQIVFTLLEKGADPRLTFADGFNTLMSAACVGDVDIVNALLARGLDVNAKDKDGETALLQAVRCDHKNEPQAQAGAREVVRSLLARGADVNAKGNDGKSVIKLAHERHDGALLFSVLEPKFKASLWTRIGYVCYQFNKLQGWGGPAIYLLAVIISGIALKIQKPLTREKVAAGDGLPRLAPLKCQRCAAPIPISLTRNQCPSCGAEARIPEDYTETLKLRAQASATLQKAERVWKRADFYNQGWLWFLVFFIGLAWLIGAIIGFFSEYSTVRPVTIFVSTILGTITFPLAFIATVGDLADLKEMFPKLPEVGKQIAQVEEVNCTTCGAQARFEANALVTACGYCGSDLYRVAVARVARKAASEEEESAAFSLYDSAVALQKRRRAFFQSTQIIGSSLLLIIAFAAVSLIILIILAALLALYLYLMLS